MVDGLRPRSGQAYGRERSRYCPGPTDSSTRSLGLLGRDDKGGGTFGAIALDAISDAWVELDYEGALPDVVEPVVRVVAMFPPSFPVSHSLVRPGPSPSSGMYW